MYWTMFRTTRSNIKIGRKARKNGRYLRVQFAWMIREINQKFIVANCDPNFICLNLYSEYFEF